MADDNTFQFNEGEYMKADEYDDFIQDPSDFWWRTYLPRVWGAAEPLAKLMPLSQVSEDSIGRFGSPEVQDALNKLVHAGREAIAWQKKIGGRQQKADRTGLSGYARSLGRSGPRRGALRLPGRRIARHPRHRHGHAPPAGKGARSPGCRGRQKDPRNPPQPELSGFGECPVAGFALHRGADGWMSDEQFKTFYWPTLRRVSLALIEEGFMVRMFAEGGYESRLEIIRDLPKGRVNLVLRPHGYGQSQRGAG